MPNYEHDSLENLFLLTQQNDKTAFDQIYNRTWESLFVSAYSMLKNEDVAKDLVQEIYIDLWCKRSTKQINHVQTYLKQAVRFKAIDRFRKVNARFESVEGFVDELTDCEASDSKLLQKEYAAVIDAWMAKLPKKRREIFRLQFEEGRTTKEISIALDLSIKTIQNQMLTSKTALKLLLEKIIYIFFLFLFGS
ncbi:sigma-70 family RNA polymerase sigma factor [Sphingobacterium sp. lm-10]|uniref:RNA polymerase sigma factor n=1 Tax=Sphingobacterium sp. lm-10 TaxID=2944904 RepID=UPI002021E772|nr:sigma-70 family RNA polymerase sigma factor [Sphingobacterium sp. lm-10]MCL7987136.1 sigma-70 family RNA polymerase sigma factor [Sphingobacterium sp. lm-10]